jgi:hypothetical protein
MTSISAPMRSKTRLKVQTDLPTVKRERKVKPRTVCIRPSTQYDFGIDEFNLKVLRHIDSVENIFLEYEDHIAYYLHGYYTRKEATPIKHKDFEALLQELSKVDLPPQTANARYCIPTRKRLWRLYAFRNYLKSCVEFLLSVYPKPMEDSTCTI